MEFAFLGTSSGVPTKQRNVSGLAIGLNEGGHWVLVDCGEGSQHQLQHCHFSLMKLEAICITHVHGDHCYGLPGLLGSMSMAGRKEPLTIIAPHPIHEWVLSTLRLSDAYMTYAIEFIDVSSEDTFKTKELIIKPWPLSHRVPSYAYSIEEASVDLSLDKAKLQADAIPRGPLWGKIQQGENVVNKDGKEIIASNYLRKDRRPRKVVVGGDNDTPTLLESACQNANVLIHESTYTEMIAKTVGPGPMHSYAASVAKFAQSFELPHLILTHFSARYQNKESDSNSITEISDEARLYFKGELFIAEDLQTYRLSKQNELALKSQIIRTFGIKASMS